MITFFFISGYAFIVSNILIILGVLISWFEKNRKSGESEDGPSRNGRDKFQLAVKISSRLLSLVGLIMMIFSFIPGTSIFLTIIVTLIGLWVTLETKAANRIPILAHALRITLVFCCFYLICGELSFWKLPKIPTGNYTKMVVIGDSLSAGIGFKGERTWVDRLRKNPGYKIEQLSVGGATVSSFLKESEEITGNKILVILEIGGNDLLRGTPIEKFKKDLNRVLGNLNQPDRSVLMFELPTPPFKGGYCRVQRQLAEEYRVYLIPKRYLAAILTSKKMTHDGLHFSNLGHKEMAQIVLKVVYRAFHSQDTPESSPKKKD